MDHNSINPTQDCALPPPLLAESAVVDLLNVSKRHLQHLRARRLVRFIKLGHAIRFRPDHLAEDIAKLTVASRAN
jgi:hypothetical protein